MTELAHKVAEELAEKLKESEITTEVEVAGRVDSYAELKSDYDPLKKKLDAIKRSMDEIVKDISLLSDEAVGSERGCSWSGHDNTLQLGARAKEVLAIDKKKLFEVLGPDIFFELASIKIGDIRKYCTPPQLEEILTEDHTGRRSVKVLSKA